MDPALLFPLVSFAFVTSVTPGPNNMMLMASGANFGFARTMPHMFGISVGHMVMTLLVGLGLVGLFHAYPQSYNVLKAVAVAYFIWIAWKFANATPPGEGQAGGRPMTFLQAAAFQWANPKAWAMSLGAVTNFAPDQSFAAVALVAAVFAVVNLPSVSLWTWMGREVRHVLTSPGRLRTFNWTMAALLIASLYPVLIH